MSFAVRRVHAKCTAFNLQRKLLPIFIKPPKGFGDGSEARLFLNIKENNFFFLLQTQIFNNSFKKKKNSFILQTISHSLKWAQLYRKPGKIMKRNFQEQQSQWRHSAATGAPQSCHHPSPDQGSAVSSSIPSRNNLSSPFPADIIWNKKIEYQLSKNQVILDIWVCDELPGFKALQVF